MEDLRTPKRLKSNVTEEKREREPEIECCFCEPPLNAQAQKPINFNLLFLNLVIKF